MHFKQLPRQCRYCWSMALTLSSIIIQLPWREGHQGDLQEDLRRTETRTIFKCDAWVPSVLGKRYWFCSMVLSHLLRLALWLLEQKRPSVLLKDSVSRADVGYLRLEPFLVFQLCLHILVGGSCFTAVCSKKGFAVGSRDTWKGSTMPGSIWPEGDQPLGEGSVRAAMWWEQTVSRSITFILIDDLFGGVDDKPLK